MKNMKDSIGKEGFGGAPQVLPSFRDMKKETMGQTYCYLNLLLRNKSRADFQNLAELLDLKQPLPLFEESLRLIVVDSLHLESEVMQIFFNQDNYQIKRTLRCHWFFKNFLDSPQLKNQIFPHVSFSLRSKIISKLSKHLTSEKNADELFEFVLKCYGLAQAEILLPKCSEQFILNYFSAERILLKSNHKCKILHMICKRYPKLGITIFTLLCEKPSEPLSNFHNYCKPLMYLAKTHNDIFVPFFKKFHKQLLFLRFGHKLTKKMGSKLKDTLFTSKELLNASVFKQSTLFKNFSNEDQVKLLSSIVLFEKDLLSFESWKDSINKLITFIKLITPNQRMIMVEAVFQKVFNHKIMNYPNLLSAQLLELIPQTIRQPYLEAHAKSLSKELIDDNADSQVINDDGDLADLNSGNLIYLLESSIAFKNFKLKLAKTPVLKRRQDLLELMVHNCALNRDINHLQLVVDYIANRMRNDDPKVLILVLQRIFDLIPLKANKIEVIQKIEEMAQMCSLKNDGYLPCYEMVMTKCIFFKLNQNLDITKSIKNLVDYKISTHSFYLEFIEDFKHERAHKFFFAFYNELYRKISNDFGNVLPDALRDMPSWILDTLLNINKFHRKNPIPLESCPELLSNLETSLTKTLKKIINFEFDVKGFIRRKPELVIRTYDHIETIGYILLLNPEVFVKNLEVLFKYFLMNLSRRHCRKFYLPYLKIFSFANLTEEVKKTLVNCFESETSSLKKKNALRMYSYLCSKEEFEERIKQYVPSNDRMDLDDSSKEFTQIQLLAPQLIKNITPSYKNLDLVLKFFVGDFLRNAVLSFSKCCHHTRIDQIIPNLVAYLIKMADDRRISLKKEVIKILVKLAPRQKVTSICLDLWKKIDHYSIRTIILKQFSSIFVEEPTVELFQALDKMIQESDEEIIEVRPSLNQIPQKFLQAYVSSLWVFSENKKPQFKNSFRDAIIAFFKIPTVSLLSPDFCEEIIKNNLFKEKGLNVVDFAVDYLLCQKENEMRKLGMFLELMTNPAADLSKISLFLHLLSTRSVNNVDFSEELLVSLCNNPFISKSTALFDDRLKLNYYRMHHGLLKLNKNERPFKFAHDLMEFYSSFEDVNNLLTIFTETLEIFFGEMKIYHNFNEIAILKEMLNLCPNPGFVVLVITVLPISVSRFFKCEDEIFDIAGDNFRSDLKYIFESLRTNTNPIIQIYFRRKFGYRKDEQR